MTKIHRGVLTILFVSFLIASTKAVAIPIYDVGDTIPGYGTVVGMVIVDNVNSITLYDGDLSGPLYLYSETEVHNSILVKDLIVSYYFKGSNNPAPEPSVLFLLSAGLMVIGVSRKLQKTS
jgi:hypothetical protein